MNPHASIRCEPLPPEGGAWSLVLVDGGLVQRLVSVGPLIRAGALKGDLTGPLRRPK